MLYFVVEVALAVFDAVSVFVAVDIAVVIDLAFGKRSMPNLIGCRG